MGNCQGFPVNSRTRISLHSRIEDEYAVQGYLVIHADCNLYQARIPTSWRDWGNNWITYGITLSSDAQAQKDLAELKRKVDADFDALPDFTLLSSGYLLLEAKKNRLADMLSLNRKPWCN